LAIETLLDTLGGHTSRAYGIDLDTPSGRARWLCVARLASERDAEETKRAAYARLDAEVGAEPSALAAADPERVARCLAAAGLRRPEPIAYGLCRAARALAETFAADLERLAAGCDDLEQLGGRLAALAPGFGRATVLRFLRPLRGVWSAARETPLADTARAAATHLGLIGDDDDLEGELSGVPNRVRGQDRNVRDGREAQQSHRNRDRRRRGHGEAASTLGCRDDRQRAPVPHPRVHP
jgi:hypothetical protein